MFSSSSRRLLAAMQVEMRYIKSRSVVTTFTILRERRGRGKTSRKDSSMNEVGYIPLQALLHKSRNQHYLHGISDGIIVKHRA